MEENNVSPDPRSTEELDALADNADKARNTERPMSAPKEAPQADPKAAPAAKDEYEFVHNGKTIKGTREQLIKWAQMGYDRPQVAQKWNQEKTKWEQERTQWEQARQKLSPYQQIDEWASKNPSQWQQLEAMWKQAQTHPGAFAQPQAQSGQFQPQGISQELQPYLSKIQTLEQQLSQLTPLVQQTVEERKTFKEQAENEKLDQEIKSIRESHKDLDWDSLDENGQSLEYRVLKHAGDNGISKFGTAFRDLLHDQLIERAQATAKQSVAKGIQTRTKLGVLGESPTSRTGVPQRTKNIRDTSYEELEREIRDELRRGVS